MNSRFGLAATADLASLLAAVVSLPIVARPSVRAPDAPIADWANVRRSAGVDAAILAWIASHVHGAPHRGLPH
jgi:hypothetical protein